MKPTMKMNCLWKARDGAVMDLRAGGLLPRPPPGGLYPQNTHTRSRVHTAEPKPAGAKPGLGWEQQALWRKQRMELGAQVSFSPQLEDILQKDAGKATSLAVAVDVAAVLRTPEAQCNGLSLRTLPSHNPFPPRAPTLRASSEGQYKGYLGEEAVQVLNVVPGA